RLANGSRALVAVFFSPLAADALESGIRIDRCHAMHSHPNPSTESPPAPSADRNDNAELRDARLAARFDAILAAPFGRIG
ncbi:hypothetical protein ABTF80_21845, partial [Acinetobacter baumannii]